MGVPRLFAETDIPLGLDPADSPVLRTQIQLPRGTPSVGRMDRSHPIPVFAATDRPTPRSASSHRRPYLDHPHRQRSSGFPHSLSTNSLAVPICASGGSPVRTRAPLE